MWTDLFILAFVVFVLLTPGTCTASQSITLVTQREADAVKSLPGWDKPLPSKQYSGYLSARGGTRHLHYYYVESENDPSNDPLTLWLNGSPGASSIAYGMMTEIGQLVFNRDSLAENTTAVPALQYNRFGWARFSNMLYLESPAGVGFSYCDELPCTSNDTSTAEDAYDGQNPISSHRDTTGHTMRVATYLFPLPLIPCTQIWTDSQAEKNTETHNTHSDTRQKETGRQPEKEAH